jgi:regulatory protein
MKGMLYGCIFAFEVQRYSRTLMKQPPKYGPAEALQKLRKYCAYQERCHQEIKQKLYEWNFYSSTSDPIVAQLIEEGFLNEERYAKALAGGKFRQKSWGRKKIINTLKQKGISEYLINSSLKEIDNTDYRKTLEQLLEKKIRTTKAANSMILKQKLARFAISKGYEADLVWPIINEMINKQ